MIMPKKVTPPASSLEQSHDLYVNPAIFTLLGHAGMLLPEESVAISYFDRARLLPAQSVVDLIASSDLYSAQYDVIRQSIYGMNWKGVARVIISLIDEHYPSLMERLNTDDGSFNFYRDVMKAMVEKINSDGDVSHAE